MMHPLLLHERTGFRLAIGARKSSAFLRALVGLCLLILCASLADKLAASARPSEKVSHHKLTSDEQLGLRLLHTSQAEASALRPDMRAFILWKISDGYKKYNLVKRDTLLKEALIDSLSIDDVAPPKTGKCHEGIRGCGVKVWLQKNILLSMTSLTEVERFLPSAQAEAQQQVKSSLVSIYIERRDFTKARSLILSLASQGDYPYKAAMDLMLALPRTDGAAKATVFAEALNAYQRTGEPETGGFSYYDDMSGMVLRFWREVPAGMVMDAIDQILGRAKEVNGGPDDPHLSVSSSTSMLSFSSAYQYRLFELLPVLEALDKPKAERLLEDSPDVRTMFDRFPDGLNAMQPDLRLNRTQGRAQKSASSVTMSFDNSSSVAVNGLVINAEEQVEIRREQMVRDVDGNAKQAIAIAMSLPEFLPTPSVHGGPESLPRSDALLWIGQTVGRRDPGTAKEALDNSRKFLTQGSLQMRAKFLNQIADEYLDIGYREGAEGTLKEALLVAEELYSNDNNSDDPNKVFKGAWPSTNEWRHCVQIAARLSADLAEGIINGIRDPEIAAFEKVYLADALLGVSITQMDTGTSNSNQSSFSIW